MDIMHIFQSDSIVSFEDRIIRSNGKLWWVTKARRCVPTPKCPKGYSVAVWGTHSACKAGDGIHRRPILTKDGCHWMAVHIVPWNR